MLLLNDKKSAKLGLSFIRPCTDERRPSRSTAVNTQTHTRQHFIHLYEHIWNQIFQLDSCCTSFWCSPSFDISCFILLRGIYWAHTPNFYSNPAFNNFKVDITVSVLRSHRSTAAMGKLMSNRDYSQKLIRFEKSFRFRCHLKGQRLCNCLTTDYHILSTLQPLVPVPRVDRLIGDELGLKGDKKNHIIDNDKYTLYKLCLTSNSESKKPAILVCSLNDSSSFKYPPTCQDHGEDIMTLNLLGSLTNLGAYRMS
ncbi:hypothetical protein DICVIV_00974 [Dictyocaulus viviparus]|uniref:Uncharacterized protein n=1 Tax=Dictyocaulus viviparus TaxID=29172 RepID=A0A0D8Y9A4_DICVI|nr:hypothetical protein DICVIV_00974 [Dictyocaulus viviparus]